MRTVKSVDIISRGYPAGGPNWFDVEIHFSDGTTTTLWHATRMDVVPTPRKNSTKRRGLKPPGSR